MNLRLCAMPLALCVAAAASAQTTPGTAAPFDSAQGVPSDSRGTPASLMTQESVNVFRRFFVDRAKVLAFYSDAIGLQPLNALNMPGGGQMSLFHIGTSQFTFTNAQAGLRVFTYFYSDEATVTKAFTLHGYAAPEFQGLLIGDPAHFEVGATVSDLSKSRAFCLDFVGLEELPDVESAYGKTYRFKLGAHSANVLNLWAAHPGAAANTYAAGRTVTQ